MKLSKLSILHVRELYATMSGDGVSAALQRKIGTTLTIALNQAVRMDVIPANPALGVKKPMASRPEMQVLTPEQVGLFLRAAKGDRLFAFYVLALDTGARPGEMFALTWADLNLDAGHVTITKSLEQIGDKQRIKEVKTQRARRRIDLSDQTIAALNDHRKRMLVEGFIGGPVFCDTIGGYIRISSLHRNSFKPILATAGLADMRLYDFRHTSATLLLLADESPKVVSERLGHSGVALTLDTYSHVLPTMQKRAAQTMNRLLGGAFGTANG